MATVKSRIEWARKTPAVLSMDMSDRIDAINILRDALTTAEKERDAITRAHNAIARIDAEQINQLRTRCERLETLLEDAVNGLKWWRDAHPEDYSSNDDDKIGEIEEALNTTETEVSDD